jgi:hypothetical protein
MSPGLAQLIALTQKNRSEMPTGAAAALPFLRALLDASISAGSRSVLWRIVKHGLISPLNAGLGCNIGCLAGLTTATLFRRFVGPGDSEVLARESFPGVRRLR